MHRIVRVGSLLQRTGNDLHEVFGLEEIYLLWRVTWCHSASLPLEMVPLREGVPGRQLGKQARVNSILMPFDHYKDCTYRLSNHY